jgi:hypothetical protein
MQAQLEILAHAAREAVQVRNERAPVYFYTASSLRLGTTITVASDRLRDIVPSTLDAPPLVLAQLDAPPGGGPPRLAAAHKISPEAWLQRRRGYAITFSPTDKAYTIVLTHLERGVSSAAAPTCAPAPMGVHAAQSTCDHAYRDQLFLTMGDVSTWAETAHERDPVQLERDARAYAALLVEVLEAQSQVAQDVATFYSPAMARVRHALTHYHDTSMGAARVSRSLALLALLVAWSMPDEEPAPATGELEPVASLSEMVDEPAAHPLVRVWMRGESALLLHRLCDPVRGAAHCDACAQHVLKQVEDTLQAPGCWNRPWISTLLGDGIAQPADARGASFVLARPLGYRVPEGYEKHEDPETGLFTVSRDVLLYTIVPMIATEHALDAAWHMATLTTVAKGTEFGGLPEFAALKEIMTRAFGTHDTEHIAVLADCRRALEGDAGAALRSAAPLPADVEVQLRQSAGAFEYGSQESEARMHAWFRALEEGRYGIGAALPDIEDLVDKSLAPPCMRDAIANTRRAQHLGHHGRFTLGSWLADAGIGTDDAIALLTRDGAVGGLWVNDFKHTHASRMRKADPHGGGTGRSLSCRNNINNADAGADVCACPFRASVPEATPLPAKITDAAVLRAIRRKCTQTLPDYQEGAWPPYAVSHPLDYVQLRLHSTGMRALPHGLASTPGDDIVADDAGA